MAGPFVTLVLDAVRDVTPGALLTLVAIADCANKKHSGRAWPSVATMAARTNRCERQVRSDLRALEGLGWIEHVRLGGGYRKATEYQLNFERMLISLNTERAAVHFRELRKLDGSLLPGFRLPSCDTPEVNRGEPGSFQGQPGSPLPNTLQPTAPELEVPEFNSTGLEPEARAPARANAEQHDTGTAQPLKTIFENLKGEPEGTAAKANGGEQSTPQPPLGKERAKPLTRDEQLAYAADAMAKARGKRTWP